jgi:hypothetical protein
VGIQYSISKERFVHSSWCCIWILADNCPSAHVVDSIIRGSEGKQISLGIGVYILLGLFENKRFWI